MNRQRIKKKNVEAQISLKNKQTPKQSVKETTSLATLWALKCVWETLLQTLVYYQKMEPNIFTS